MRIHVVAAMAVASLSLSACVSPYVGKPYDRTASNVQSINIVDDSVPTKITAWEVASVGSNFGLIGALADAAVTASREEALNNALNGAGFDAEARLEEHLVKALGDAGYTATASTGTAREKRVFLTSYTSNGTPDAHLDLVITNYGYIASGAGQPWRPTASATVRLVSAKDPSKVLMENQIVYNAMYVQAGSITLSPDPQYAFKNREDMLSDPARLAAGVEGALNAIADTAVELLK